LTSAYLTEDCPTSHDLARLLSWADNAAVQMGLNDAHELTITYDGDTLPAGFKDALRQHKQAILTILKARALFTTIETRIIQMRYSDPTKGTRLQAFAWLRNKLAEFKKLCNLKNGYTDPSDDFADTAISCLQHELDELTAEGTPYPVSVDDPRERYDNGKLVDAPGTEYAMVVTREYMDRQTETDNAKWVKL